MPQVYFDANEFRGKEVSFDPEEIVAGLITRNAEILRLIGNPWNLPRVPGFNEAALDGFDGWDLHHVGGESIPLKTLRSGGLYWRRPWYELRFMRSGEHRAIHLSTDFKEAYYGI